MVARVAGAREAVASPSVWSPTMWTFSARHRRELAPEACRSRRRTAARALRSSRLGIDEVRRADLRDVHLQARVLAHEHARGAGVVEVDVREEQVADVA